VIYRDLILEEGTRPGLDKVLTGIVVSLISSGTFRRLKRRENMNSTAIQSRRVRGFAVLDPLLAILVFATVMVGAINFWRLVEYKCARARIDARVSQILRENTDYVTYVAYDLLPADGTQLRSGFLLHPLDPNTGLYRDIYPFSVTAAVTTTGGDTPAEVKQIVLTLTYNTAPGPQAADSPLQMIRTHALSRVKG
jgi:hypothetical protein